MMIVNNQTLTNLIQQSLVQSNNLQQQQSFNTHTPSSATGFSHPVQTTSQLPQPFTSSSPNPNPNANQLVSSNYNAQGQSQSGRGAGTSSCQTNQIYPHQFLSFLMPTTANVTMAPPGHMNNYHSSNVNQFAQNNNNNNLINTQYLQNNTIPSSLPFATGDTVTTHQPNSANAAQNAASMSQLYQRMMSAASVPNAGHQINQNQSHPLSIVQASQPINEQYTANKNQPGNNNLDQKALTNIIGLMQATAGLKQNKDFQHFQQSNSGEGNMRRRPDMNQGNHTRTQEQQQFFQNNQNNLNLNKRNQKMNEKATERQNQFMNQNQQHFQNNREQNALQKRNIQQTQNSKSRFIPNQNMKRSSPYNSDQDKNSSSTDTNDQQLNIYRENKKKRLGCMSFHKTQGPISSRNIYIPCLPKLLQSKDNNVVPAKQENSVQQVSNSRSL